MHPYHIVSLKSTNSTNNWAKQAISEAKITANTVIVAETQTAGRGQMQTKWHDVAGKNLLFTLVIQPKHLKANRLFALNQAVCVALITALPKNINPKIKWPNDILVGTKKLAGVLIETVLRGDEVQWAYIGIGLNVNQSNFYKTLNATSLALEQNNDFDLQELLNTLLNQLHFFLQDLGSFGLHQQYLKHLYAYNQNHLFTHNGKRFAALVQGITEEGKLQLLPRGAAHSSCYNFKEVLWVFPNE